MCIFSKDRTLMDLNDLRRLVRAGEHLHLEFKRKANHPEKIIRELVAFANTGGGTLLLGVDDDGSIYGSKCPVEDEYALRQSIQRNISPPLPVTISHVAVTSRRSVLVFEVDESLQKPHRVQENTKRAYVRVRDMTVQASREMVSLMHHSRRERGVKITYGEKEREVLRLLDEHSKTTLEETRRQLQISKRRASGLLVTLVRAGLVRIHPTAQEDFFTLAPEAFSHS